MRKLNQIIFDELDITSGEIIERSPFHLSIEEPSVRATLLTNISRVACIQFRYLDATAKRVKSKDGKEFHQVGLKLLSKDPCNLVYVMWRIRPQEELVVQVKRNVGKTKSCECENNGYTTIIRHPLLPFVIGETHELMAEVLPGDNDGIKIKVWIDWEEILLVPIVKDLIEGITGPPGIRSDNGRYDFRYSIALSDDTSNHGLQRMA